MKYLFAILICFLLVSCSKQIKTYFSNGKIETQCLLDENGRKNGIFKVYDTLGVLQFETEITHDTLSGLVRCYNVAGKVTSIIHFKRGLYQAPLNQEFFLFGIHNYSDIESFIYDDRGALTAYTTETNCHNDTCWGMLVRYAGDSIKKITGTPNTPFVLLSRNNNLKKGTLSVNNVPKCSTNFYVFDSADNVVSSCKACGKMNLELDFSKYYSLKVEYKDSLYGITHSIREPLVKWNKSRFPNGIVTDWDRE